jgi:crotonobetainyl-CoA:carnitine CoA-transferase CaiB-like acyl-CoA transferase
VAQAVAHLTRAEIEARLVGVPCAPVNHILEAMEDPQATATGARIETEGVPHVASPHRFHV